MKTKFSVDVTTCKDDNTPMAALKRTFGEEFEKLSRGEKLFLIYMTAAQLYATEPEKVNEEVFSGVLVIHRSFSIPEQENVLLSLVSTLQENANATSKRYFVINDDV
ncbi:hypothetical protein IQ243_26405 [Nostocales cyanobacterium LEGE 11386]|nr:hypothetical protein [Nostocales cyanobacterium LEGE 11386]